MGLVKFVVAVIAAVIVQPVVGFAHVFLPYLGAREPLPYSQVLDFIGWVLVVAAIFVLLLGVPTYYLLKFYGKATKGRVSFAGFAIAAAPTIVLGWPHYMSGYSSGVNWHGSFVELYKDGVPTIYAWLTHIESIFWFGLHGFVGALVFYLLMSKNNEPQQAAPADGLASRRSASRG